MHCSIGYKNYHQFLTVVCQPTNVLSLLFKSYINYLTNLTNLPFRDSTSTKTSKMDRFKLVLQFHFFLSICILLLGGFMAAAMGLYMAAVKDHCATRDQTYDHKQILYAMDYFAILVGLTICVVTFIGFCATFSGSKTLRRC